MHNPNPGGTLPLSKNSVEVRSSGMSLAHAPAQLKGKKELVMEARHEENPAVNTG